MDYGIQHGGTLINGVRPPYKRGIGLKPIPFLCIEYVGKINCGFLNSSLHMCRMELYSRRVKTIILVESGGTS